MLRSPQPGAGLGTNASLAQMVSGLVGQLLMQPVLVGESVSFSTSDGSSFPVLSTRMEMLWGLVFLEFSAVFFCSL